MSGQREIVRRFGTPVSARPVRRPEKSGIHKYMFAGTAVMIGVVLILLADRFGGNSTLAWLMAVPGHANAEGRLIIFESSS